MPRTRRSCPAAGLRRRLQLPRRCTRRQVRRSPASSGLRTAAAQGPPEDDGSDGWRTARDRGRSPAALRRLHPPRHRPEDCAGGAATARRPDPDVGRPRTAPVGHGGAKRSRAADGLRAATRAAAGPTRHAAAPGAVRRLREGGRRGDRPRRVEKGPGHQPGTAMPGQVGNLVLRDTARRTGRPSDGWTNVRQATTSSCRPRRASSRTACGSLRSWLPPPSTSCSRCRPDRGSTNRHAQHVYAEVLRTEPAGGPGAACRRGSGWLTGG